MIKKIFSLLAVLGAGVLAPAFAQNMSIDEAIAIITAEAKSAVVSGFRENDETGDFQFVDAEIKSVHDLNDYSYGSMMNAFESLLDRRLKLATSDAASTMWPEERQAVKLENPRMLQYAKDNMTRIVGYSAVVDFVGITKFRERKEVHTILYFNSKGEFIESSGYMYESLLRQIIGAESSDIVMDRDNVKSRLAPYMFQQIATELQADNDPLFLRKEYWISNIEQSESAGKAFEMQWCYRLTKTNTDDTNTDKGKFRAYYYQVQKGSFLTIKMILVVEGTYEKDKEHIWFSYDSANATSYHITYDATEGFEPDNYKSIDYSICTPQVSESRKIQKLIRAEKNTPNGYKWIDSHHFQMVAPIISDKPCTFSLAD